MSYYLHRKYWIGVNGDLDEALAAEFPGEMPPRAQPISIAVHYT